MINMKSQIKPPTNNKSIKIDLPITHLKPSPSTKEITRVGATQQSAKKLIHRKPYNEDLQVRSLKHSPNHHGLASSPRYIINNTSFQTVQMTESVTKKPELAEALRFDLKTQRKQLTTDKINDRHAHQKKYDNDSADYYKYWKKKANDYQELNFNLHRLNSSLQQQNQILKHKLEKMEKKLLKMYQPEKTNYHDQLNNYQKLENYYKIKVDQMSKKIEEQQLLINKQQKKIKQLSKTISQNYQLKNLLNNMEEKVSQLRSMGSKDSRTDSIQNLSEKQSVDKPKNNFLEINYIDPSHYNKSAYGLKKEKKVHSSSFAESKSATLRQKN